MSHHFDHVYWMGGSPCSGKSSIADMLAARCNWQVYHCDEAYERHVRQAQADLQPHLSAGSGATMDWNAFWMRSPDVLMKQVIDIYAEEFPMILDDLRSLPRDRSVLVEGTALMPEFVAEVLTDPRRAIWVIPTAAFQFEFYPQRGAWVAQILAQCSQPELALQNWMNRDQATAQHVRQEAAARQLRVLDVDGSRTIENNARVISQHFSGAQRR
ncbi:MAG: ATP-binding protein [Anaerolineae bacterium]|nr:ATP-binding protein [Anaerolineae bacterium]